MTEFETDYLAHHGIKGQRWGVRRTPEQLGHAPAKSVKTVGKQLAKSVKSAVKNYKAKKEANAAAEHEKLKDYLVKHPSKMVKYSSKLSKEDVQELVDRIQTNRKLQDIKADETRRGMAKIKSLSDSIGTISTFMQNSKNLYNNTADIYNGLIDVGVIKGHSKLSKFGVDNKEDRSAFEKLIRSGDDDAILKAFDTLTSNEQRDVINRKRNAADFKKLISGEDDKDNKKNEKDKSSSSSSQTPNVQNRYLIELIQQGRYDDAERYFPDEMAEFYRILNK